MPFTLESKYEIWGIRPTRDVQVLCPEKLKTLLRKTMEDSKFVNKLNKWEILYWYIGKLSIFNSFQVGLYIPCNSRQNTSKFFRDNDYLFKNKHGNTKKLY